MKWLVRTCARDEKPFEVIDSDLDRFDRFLPQLLSRVHLKRPDLDLSVREITLFQSESFDLLAFVMLFHVST